MDASAAHELDAAFVHSVAAWSMVNHAERDRFRRGRLYGIFDLCCLGGVHRWADGGDAEYLGKKIEAFDIKMAMLTTVFPFTILILTAISF